MKYKLIFNPIIARKLLKMGNVIVDIKPHKKYKDRTIFIFEYNDKLKNDLNLI